MELGNEGNITHTQYGVEKLVATKYKYWRLCMEACLQGQDLWDLVTNVLTEILKMSNHEGNGRSSVERLSLSEGHQLARNSLIILWCQPFKKSLGDSWEFFLKPKRVQKGYNFWKISKK